jgi:hypothetical protein
MGGNALKKVITVRKNKIEYNETKIKVSNKLLSRGIIFDTIPELADKESFGDLDILVSFSHNSNIMRDIVIEIFNPTEVVSNGNVISFDFDNFQIDIINCKTIEFAKFYFSYSDFGNILGRILTKYKMSLGHNYFFLKNEKYSLILTDDVNKFCEFIGFDFKQWERIQTKEDMFELIKTCKFYKPEIFNFGNYHSRKNIIKRPIHQDFLNYINIYEVKGIEYDKEVFNIDAEKILNDALDYFNKHEEIENINKAIEKAKIIHNKFNGNMLIEMGYNSLQIGTIIRKLKNDHPNYDEWIYNTTIENIYKEIIDFCVKVF